MSRTRGHVFVRSSVSSTVRDEPSTSRSCDRPLLTNNNDEPSSRNREVPSSSGNHEESSSSRNREESASWRNREEPSSSRHRKESSRSRNREESSSSRNRDEAPSSKKHNVHPDKASSSKKYDESSSSRNHNRPSSSKNAPPSSTSSRVRPISSTNRYETSSVCRSTSHRRRNHSPSSSRSRGHLSRSRNRDKHSSSKRRDSSPPRSWDLPSSSRRRRDSHNSQWRSGDYSVIPEPRLTPRPSYWHQAGNEPLTGKTLGQLAEDAARLWPQREAVVSMHQGLRLTFQDTLKQADKLAAGLRGLGMQPGDRLGLCGPNSVEWYITNLAAARAGLILVNINPAYQVAELEYCLSKVGVKALVVPETFKSQNYHKMLQAIAPELASCQPGKLQNDRIPTLKSIITISDKELPGSFKFKNLFKSINPDDLSEVHQLQYKIQPDAGCNLQFTSGTTGLPKGTLLSHHNVVNNAYFAAKRLGFHHKHHRICLQVPLFHCFGNVLGIIMALHAGSTLVLPSYSFRAEDSVNAIAKESHGTISRVLSRSYFTVPCFPVQDATQSSTELTGRNLFGLSEAGQIGAASECIEPNVVGSNSTDDIGVLSICSLASHITINSPEPSSFSRSCTIIYGTPTMYIDIMAKCQDSPASLSSLEFAITAGSPSPPNLFYKIANTLGLKKCYSVYGMTETSPLSFVPDYDDPLEQCAKSVGRVMDHCEVKVVDLDNKMVPMGTPGELLVRGYGNMLCYYNDVDKTQEIVGPDRWLRTGDQFILHESGYGEVVGRIKDMIIRGGENIFPKEIEDFLITHGDIVDAQIIGIPDERYGEEICACVRLKPGSQLSEEDLKGFCKGKIAHFKIPKYVKFMNDYPRTQSGKVQKYKLRDMILSRGINSL
ncbi:Long-chain-fatty-acid--CoA ligase bubblegum-like [Gryllus bimaculatus]|nr:Long-chain-fatty-acid--CoA ligase bubblegum-like [Gryllus bimaculatus]